MSALSSSSSLDDVIDAYLDNASYEEDASVSKARAFVTACRILLVKLPMRSTHGRGGSIEFKPETLQAALKAAQAWIQTQPGDGGQGGVRHLDFSGFRD